MRIFYISQLINIAGCALFVFLFSYELLSTYGRVAGNRGQLFCARCDGIISHVEMLNASIVNASLTSLFP